MKKSLKSVMLLVGILLLLVIFSAISIITFVSPNRFKPLIAEQVMKYTGRQLTMDGDLSWTVFPYLGIKTGHILLKNPESFSQKTFAEIDHMIISIKLFPLLHKKIEFSRFDVENAKINWIDQQNKQSVSLKNFSLHTKNVSLLNSFPMAGEFDFLSEHPALSGHMAFSYDASINLDQQVFSFRNFILKTMIIQGSEKLNGKMAGDIIADLSQKTIEWSNFRGQIENVNLTGRIGVRNLATNAMDIQGQLAIDKAQINHIQLSNIVIPLHYQIGILELGAITADCYKGSLQALIKINLTGAVPQIATQGKLVNIQVGPLLQDLSANQTIGIATGIGTIDFQTTTFGLNLDTLLKNLNGAGHIKINHGVVQGIDIGYLLDSAYAFTKQKTVTTSDTHQTDFGDLTAMFIIQNGLLINDDLLINSTRFITHGKGNINLVDQKIDFHLQVVLNQSIANPHNNWGNLYGLAIPVHIAGNLKNPSIRLDAGVLAQEIAQEEIKKVESKVKEQLQDKVKGNAGKLLQNLLGQ